MARKMGEEGNPSLQSPLIPSYEKSSESRGGEGLVDNVDWKRDIADEMKKQLWLAGPLVAVSFLQFCLQTISVMFVGHLGELSLASASMATSFAGVTGFSFLIGMGSALDTLCGQSYGAKQYHMLGIHMQRAMLVLLLVSIPLAVIWAYTGQILLALGQDPEISVAAGLYARWMIPCIFAYGLLQCHVRFLQTQNIVFPMVISSGFTALLHLFICWVLVFKSGLGNKGAALANSISYWINVVLLAFYVKFSPACKKTWTGFSKEALHDVFSFIRLAIPSAVMVCLEFWSFELLVLLSGLLPNPKLETSVLSISLNTCSMLFMIPFGLGGAVSTRVSNELGAGRPQTARLAVMVVVVVAVTVGVIVGLTMILVRGIWGNAYSNEGEVVRYVAVMMPILATSNFLDGIQCVLSGTARGCGWQKIGAYVNLAAYYIVGVPSAVLLAFVLHFGGKGLWMGIVCGLTAQVLMLSTITLCTNWEQERGMGSALDTLCGQSYGAKQYHMLGIYMQRAMFVLLLISIPLAIIWAYTGQILIALGQDPEISAAAGQYARWMIPCIFAFGLLQCQVRFLQTQNIVFPMMICTGITALLHLFICWVLVFKSGLGNKGAALANSISYWINASLLALYVKFSPACKKTWTGFSKEALHNVPNFIRLAIPSAVMLCLETWSFELMVLLSGLLPNPKLETSVLSISLNTTSILYMIPFGLSSAISTRVSNELGAGRPQTARLAVIVVVIMVITVDVIVGLPMILVRDIWGYAYSNEEEVVRYVAVMMPVLATSLFLDGIQSVLSGTARGSGWQKIGAYVNLGAFYIVGIPSAVLLAFVLHVGGKGLWMGLVCGLLAQVLMLLTITLRTNWEQEAKKAKERVYDSSIPIDLAS